MTDKFGNEIRHSVGIICFNQEKYINNAIDSLLMQTILPYEIIICDDSSTDNTLKIISEYKSKFPDLIQVYSHSQNKGIYGNQQFARDHFSGNIFSLLAGDDYYSGEYIEVCQNEILKKNINVKAECFQLITNNVMKYPNGIEVVWNNFKNKNISAFKNQLRLGLSHRQMGYSKVLIDQLTPLTVFKENYPDIKYGVDLISNLEETLICKSHIYIDYISQVYNLGVGVTSHGEEKKEAGKRLHQTMQIIENLFSKNMDKADYKFVAYNKSIALFLQNPNILSYCKALAFYFYNFNNHNSNYPWIKNLHYFLPVSWVTVIKLKIYPIFSKLILNNGR
jgi:glycosyltransferase involved in cell wall biosynthesis